VKKTALKSHDFSYAERNGFYVAEVVRLRTGAGWTCGGKSGCRQHSEFFVSEKRTALKSHDFSDTENALYVAEVVRLRTGAGWTCTGKSGCRQHSEFFVWRREQP